MKKENIFILIVFITILVFMGCSSDLVSELPQSQKFNKGWKFKIDKNDNINATDNIGVSWANVDLPHDWSILGDFNTDNPAGAKGAFLPTGIGWYRKDFKISKKYKSSVISIRFDGIYRNSTVWINGHLLGNRPNGYIEVRYDMTPYLNYGNKVNIIDVKVDNSVQPNSRWYTGSGIYRNVWLEFSDKIHFKQWGLQITSPKVSAQRSVMKIRYGIINESSESENITLQTQIYDPKGEIIYDNGVDWKIKSDNDPEYKTLEIEILSPELWSPDNPKVYKIKSILKRGKKILDSKVTVAGIRTFRFDPDKGFYLNEIPLKIKGVCIHSAAGAVGAAVPDGIIEYRLKKLKDLGCNAIRFSHNPTSPEVLNMCDTLGFLVMTEAFDEWEMKKKWGVPNGYHIYFDQWHKKDLTEMIRRDYNHPSIIMYSIGNEIQEQRDAMHRGVEIAKELVAICHKEDATRPVTSACDQISNANKTGLAQVLDIVGYNYQDKHYQEDHKKYPNRIILGSETHQFPSTWNKVLKNDYVAGEFLWVGFDYLGEADKYPLKGWENGMFDTTGNIKPRGLLRRTLWRNEPQVYIFAQDPDWEKDISAFAPWSWEKLHEHWNWPHLKGKMINVKCYTNCDEVELFLNGESKGIKKFTDISSLPLSWQIKYDKGILKAVAKKDGNIIAEDVLRTSGKAMKLQVNNFGQQFINNDSDISVLQVKVTDQNGIIVPGAQNLLRFEIKGNGKIMAVDNGDLRSNERFRGNKRKAFKGKAICIIKALDEKRVKVTVTSDGLEPASIIINNKEK